MRGRGRRRDGEIIGDKRWRADGQGRCDRGGKGNQPGVGTGNGDVGRLGRGGRWRRDPDGTERQRVIDKGSIYNQDNTR